MSFFFFCLWRDDGDGGSGDGARSRQRYDDLYVCDREISGAAVGAAFEPVLVDPIQQYYSLALLKEKYNN